jgi:sugar phosphate isomerase/epimerase
MKLQDDPPLHLTYCLNIHPGESWEENFKAIREKTLAVKRAVAPDKAFGLGLRLSARAAQTLRQPKVIADLLAFLDANGLYVFTINGFPYGQFHEGKIKEAVYRPDWSDEARRDYTNTLADILAKLLPEGVSGSISTVPLAHKKTFAGSGFVDVREKNLLRMQANVGNCAWHLASIRRRIGKQIVLAFEPEPGCLIESTDEVEEYLPKFIQAASANVPDSWACSPGTGADMMRRHLGVCVDVCHLAVEFEDPEQSIQRLVKAGLTVAKVQLSSALRCAGTPEALKRLHDFSDPVYLHQVKVRTADAKVLSYADLPDALTSRGPSDDEEWRIHFHVPLYVAEYEELQSTSGLYTAGLAKLLRSGVTSHLEIETYTFDVLPKEAREPDVVRSIVKEYQWVLRYLTR